MKHLKSYENLFSKWFNPKPKPKPESYIEPKKLPDYNIGDYVTLKDLNNRPSKIIDKDQSIIENGGFVYTLEVFNSNDELITINFDKFAFGRKLTPEEIEDFELKKTINKYNL